MKSSVRGRNAGAWSGVTRAIVLLLAVVGVLSVTRATAGAADSPTTSTAAGINIVSPTEGESLVNTNIQISGTAPQGVLVAVTITDTDTNQPLVEHQPFGKIQGTVTSDQDGQWIFTPQQAVIPGPFSVKAIFTTADNQTVSSRTIQFVVTTSSGSSHVFSQATIRGALVVASGLLLLIVCLTVYFIKRHRRKRREAAGDPIEDKRPKVSAEDPDAEFDESEPEQRTHEHGAPLFMGTSEGKQYKERQDAKMKAFEEETFRIEDELAKTAQELEQANAQVIALRSRFSHQQDGGEGTVEAEQQPMPGHKRKK